jgi:hypothetical protein
VAALLAQIPLLGRVGALPGVTRIRAGLAGATTAVATVGALVVVGVVGGQSNPGEPAAARQGVQAAAAPAPPPAAPASDATAAAETAAAPLATTTSGPAARPAPSIDKLLAGVATTVGTPSTVPPTSGPPSGSPPAEQPPSPPQPAPPPPPQPFTAEGQLLAPDLLGRIGLGLTNRGPVGGCGPSGSQGLDAYVFELPADGPGPGAPVKATGSDLLGLHNLAVTFVSEDCEIMGQLDTPAADEAGLLPAGTRYVVVSDRLGIGTSVTLTVG